MLRLAGVAMRGLGLRIPASRKPAGPPAGYAVPGGLVPTAAAASGMGPPPGADRMSGPPSLAVRSEPAVTYWRRRFVVLAVALATLAVTAWSLSEALRVQPDLSGPSATGHGPSGGAAAPQAGGSHSGGAGTHRAGGSPGAGTRTHAGHRPGAAHTPKASSSHGAFGGFKPKFCSWHSIVLSASANQVSLGPGQQPTFSLSVVSTQPTDCSFNVGPAHLALVIREGPARIWSSADCVSGTGSLVTALRRGVPTDVAIGWNEKTSAPGCNGPARSVPAGRYTAYAVDGSLVSAPVTFRLG
jgi:hypothetical protein